MRFPALCSAAILALCLAGCEQDSFQIEIRPDGQGFQRRLTGWHVHGGEQPAIKQLPASQLDRLAKLYPNRESPEGEAKQVFSGRFADTTPDDIGGAGSYSHFASPLGSTTSYVERFRGNDDLESDLAQRRQGADQLTDLLIGWFATELGQDPAFPRLKKFLDEDLRKDLKNFGLYAWTAGMAAEDQTSSKGEFIARVGLYLVERGYFSPKQVPTFVRAVAADDVSLLLTPLQRFVARKMGVPDEQPIPASLAFLGDPARLAGSLEKYVRSTDLFRQRIAQWEAAKKEKPDTKEPTPGDVLIDLGARTIVGQDFKIILGAPGDTLKVNLISGVKPYATNGAWDEAAGAVHWSQTLARHRTLPVMCFAVWSTPERAFQEQHFGRVLLADTDLAQYAVWYRALKPEEAAEWDRFVSGLKPGDGLKTAVEGYRFSTDAKPDPRHPDKTPSSLADIPRRLILDKLTPPSAARPSGQ